MDVTWGGSHRPRLYSAAALRLKIKPAPSEILQTLTRLRSNRRMLRMPISLCLIGVRCREKDVFIQVPVR